MSVTALAACPTCGSALRPGQPWCTLCYADLRPAPEPAPEPAREAAPEPSPEPERAPVTLPAGLVVDPVQPLPVAPAWPCTGCGSANPYDLDACAGCGQAFLAGARHDAPLLVLPLVGDLGRLERSHRLALAVGVVVAFLALVLILGLLFG